MATVESFETGAVSNTSTLTLTKPTGLAEGDMLYMHVASYNASAGVEPPNLSGWTSLGTTSIGSGFAKSKAYSKIADAGDVAASNFSIDFGETIDDIRGAIYRVSSPTTPVVRDSGSSTPIVSVNNAVIIAAVMTDDGTSVSGYTISGTNPTWTEDFDNSEATNSGLATARAVDPNSGNITSFTYTLGAAESSVFFLVTITDQTDANPDISHLAITPTVESVTGSNTANADIFHLAITPSVENVKAEDNSDRTQWANQNKPNTNWTNKEI